MSHTKHNVIGLEAHCSDVTEKPSSSNVVLNTQTAHSNLV